MTITIKELLSQNVDDLPRKICIKGRLYYLRDQKKNMLFSFTTMQREYYTNNNIKG